LDWKTYNDYVCHSIKLVDGNVIPLAGSDLVFKAINGKPMAGNNSKIALVRFEFMEILMRLAFKRYNDKTNPKIGDLKSLSDSITMLGKHFELEQPVNCQKFRDERFWNEACDNLLKANKALLEEVYHTKSGKHKKPGEKRYIKNDFTFISYMAHDEFLNLMVEADLMTESFPDREITIAYNLSMITQVDEIFSDRHMKMEFIEFLEAIARSAEKISKMPAYAVVKITKILLVYNNKPEEWPYARCMAQPLHEKIENILPDLLRTSKKDFRDKYIFPTKDPFTNLFYLSPTKRKAPYAPKPSSKKSTISH
jgi:NLR family CARD domain-containing protein 3